jgi:hypothetical protein
LPVALWAKAIALSGRLIIFGRRLWRQPTWRAGFAVTGFRSCSVLI